MYRRSPDWWVVDPLPTKRRGGHVLTGIIDAIGFFPQMLVCGVSAIILFSMMVKRELQYLDAPPDSPPAEFKKEAAAPLSIGLQRMRRGGSSVDIRSIGNLGRISRF